MSNLTEPDAKEASGYADVIYDITLSLIKPGFLGIEGQVKGTLRFQLEFWTQKKL